jgi:shikimate kinase
VTDRASEVKRQIVLIGMMGVGKSTVGRMLAAHLGRDFWDNDDALTKTTGRTAAEVQTADGQAALHRLENHLLAEGLRTRTPTVFAAASSVVLHPEILRGSLTVWLRASPEAEERNLAGSGQHHRPLPAAPDAYLRRLAAERDPIYAHLADVIVDVGADPETTYDSVLEALAGTEGVT